MLHLAVGKVKKVQRARGKKQPNRELLSVSVADKSSLKLHGACFLL
jgi:hypothetical protein